MKRCAVVSKECQFHVAQSTSTVELWSTERLQFQPKGQMRQLKKALASAIGRVPRRRCGWLYAAYCSADVRPVDLENVLFYNAGTGAFARTTQRGIAFERVIAAPPPCNHQLDWTPRHYHLYQFTGDIHPSRYWETGGALARWVGVALPPLRGEVKPHMIWSAMKHGVVIAECNEPPKFFGVELVLQVPNGVTLNLTAVAKPLLDGLLSALHVHDGGDLLELATRLGSRLGQIPDETARLLMDDSFAVLGPRRLLHRFGEWLKWNPADDCLVSVAIRVEPGDGWTMTGKLVAVSQLCTAHELMSRE